VAGRGVVGPPYATALRLYAIAAVRWEEVDSAYAALDIIRETPYRFCGLVYGWCVKHMDEERREQFDYDLSAPLPGREKAAPAQAVAEIEGQAFMAAMMQHQMVTGG
jgi:hypothetical protein